MSQENSVGVNAKLSSHMLLKEPLPSRKTNPSLHQMRQKTPWQFLWQSNSSRRPAAVLSLPQDRMLWRTLEDGHMWVSYTAHKKKLTHWWFYMVSMLRVRGTLWIYIFPGYRCSPLSTAENSTAWKGGSGYHWYIRTQTENWSWSDVSQVWPWERQRLD